MIAIITGWVVISFVLLSFGDMFIRLYTKFCKNEESYGILDTFILGLCAVTVLLSFTSLWLPSNQYMLFVYILLSLIYWICNRRVLMSHINHVKNILKSLSFLQKSLLFIVMASVFFYMLFSAFSGDAGFYHHQNIRWNEEYRVVPGLANFEDRYGFNSSYMLLSAIFTFRFIFGEAVYMLQSLLFVLILCWIMVNLFRSKYDFRYLLMLFLMFYALMWGGYMIADTNTDSIPLLCTFYFLSKTAINPDWLKKQPLMAFLLPVTLVTFKVSMAIFCLVSLGVLIYLIRQKKNRSVCFLLSASVFTIVLWCIRNVIISGYLVYPMYNIDLFDFDWKVPVGTAALQKMYIYDWAKIAFESFYINSIERLYSGHKFDFINNVVNLILFLYIVVSPFIVIYNILKRRK